LVASLAMRSSLMPVQGAPFASPYINYINGDTYRDSTGAAWVDNGLVTMTCGSKYNGWRAVNDTTDTYSWIIVGDNFGSSQGSVTLAGRSARIASWTANKIIAYPSVPYDSGPMSTLLKITTVNGTLSYGVSIVPAIKSRVFGQCTHHVAYKRKTLGLSVSPTAYGGYSSFSTTYVPRVGDQLQWNGKHTAIIVAVNAYYDGGWSRYNIQVSEQNYDCRNSTRTFWDYFEVGIVSGSKKITHYLTHPSMGKATSYFR
jgi:hypothetical protein